MYYQLPPKAQGKMVRVVQGEVFEVAVDIIRGSPTVFLYKTTDYYAPVHERCIRWDDPDIGIWWPIDAASIFSPKDQAGSKFAYSEVFT